MNLELIPILARTITTMSLRLATAKIAYEELGVHEDTPNWSKEIAEYLKEANITVPAPWCAAFVNWCAKQAADQLNLLSPLEDIPLQGYVQSYVDYGTAHFWNVGFSDVRVGDLFAIYFPSLKRYGHIGFVYKPLLDENKFITIEGNSNIIGSREGIAVVSNTRNVTDKIKFLRWTRTVSPKTER